MPPPAELESDAVDDVVYELNEAAAGRMPPAEKARRITAVLDAHGDAVDRHVSALTAELAAAGLSPREAVVTALLAEGFTHKAIVELLTAVTDESIALASVDEYARRARGKYRDAASLVHRIESTNVLDHVDW